MTCVSPSLVERFKAKVVLGLTSQDCWGWSACKIAGRYGCIRHNGQSLYAHRLSWLIHNGSIPDDAYVLHKCDNPLCTNPLHLFLGDQMDNMQDMFMKGREHNRKGEANIYSKLNATEVLEIRQRAASGEEYESLGQEFGVCASHVCKIVGRKVWRHLV